MRVEFVVASDKAGWSVRRGVTSPLHYASRERALAAAERLAEACTDTGDTGVVKIAEGEALREHRCFRPERPPQPAAVERRPVRREPFEPRWD